ncbi:MAG: PEP/pyruvate-binding domain-containing protein, partial [Calditrichota bacterium]
MLSTPPTPGSDHLTDLRRRFGIFRRLLDRNSQTLRIIADMEEKAREEYVFDFNYIRKSLSEVETGVADIIELMVELGGEKYGRLRERYSRITEEIAGLMPGGHPILRDELTIPLRGISRERAFSVGSKNAQLGEMKIRLGLPVPGGFAVTAWAYKMFMEASYLQSKISRLIAEVDLCRFEDLERVSETIQKLVLSTPLPEEIVSAIQDGYLDLEECKRTERFSMRSSAVGEDTHMSFAGQYATYLNLRAENLPNAYRRVISSKFTPKAIYYYLSHDLQETDLAMSVCCLEMIEAAASGVVYTRDPIQPDSEDLIINSIKGLGKYLMDGLVEPNQFRISRSTGEINERQFVRQTIRLICNPEGGIIEEAIPAEEQMSPPLDDEILRVIGKYAQLVEDHYQTPQEIEWAWDRWGKVFLLQTRPLRVWNPQSTPPLVLRSSAPSLLSGGSTIYPGAVSGP